MIGRSSRRKCGPPHGMPCGTALTARNGGKPDERLPASMPFRCGGNRGKSSCAAGTLAHRSAFLSQVDGERFSKTLATSSRPKRPRRTAWSRRGFLTSSTSSLSVAPRGRLPAPKRLSEIREPKTVLGGGGGIGRGGAKKSNDGRGFAAGENRAVFCGRDRKAIQK
jgi:hypothetical protein